MYRRIVVALDGSELAELALPHAEALAAAFGAGLVLMRVTTPPAGLMAAEASIGMIPDSPMVSDPVPMTEPEQREAASYLTMISGQLRGRGRAVDVDEPEGNPAEAITVRARELAADLIVMTTHGHGGLGRALFGSVAEHVLRHSPCPVLVVPTRES